ncbi:MAG: ABC transporter ATP-binding protein [Coriobacteriia bacterium]|nr:ABC transporter ATP-binding protein [Coriobacteriia bacterium]
MASETSKIIDVDDLSFRYPNGDRDVLSDVSFTVGPGEILSILGPNGSGKSTLLDCLASLRRPSAGTILVVGHNITTMSQREIARVIGYVPQIHIPAFSYRVLDFVLMGRAPNIGFLQKPGDEDIERAYNALEEVGITHLAQRNYLDISGGERQQTTIARAICQQPRVILFDEPTAHLDYGNQHRILTLIKHLSEHGFTVVITTHNPDHALLLGGNTAILSRQGTLTCGRSDEMLTEERLQELYGLDLRITHVPQAHRIACLAPTLVD